MDNTLSALRKLAGMTQTKVASLCEINLRYYQKIESGENPLSNVALKTAVKLANALGITLDELAKIAKM
ncbi:MAG: helix-turn-helix transcriptional regulator [Bacillota bacterium]